MTQARWVLGARDPDRESALARALDVSPLLARLLLRRGVVDADVGAAFLETSLAKNLRSPMLFREMRTAAGRLLEAVRRNERILVYGDYDVDGITGSAELLLFLRELGCSPDLFIPHRLRDGYGLRSAALEAQAAKGVRVVVTVDCGAASHEELAHARRLGLDVIVCDHHQVPETRPPAFAVLNPVVSDAGFPFSGLCAAGVVFYLLLGTRMLLREEGNRGPDLRRYLDLVALGTVADLVPLLEENRVLVKHGLKEIARTERPGVRALLELARIEEVSAGSIAFALGPRINATGRLADASTAVELLTSLDVETARGIAAALDRHNRDRRDIEEATVEEAERQIAGLRDRDGRRSFVLASEGWHPGVVGIVASRLVERHHRPVILLAIEGDECRGSGRGIPGLNLVELLRGCAPLLGRFGGHRAAVGLSLAAARLGEFAAAFEREVAARWSDDLAPTIVIDDEVPAGRMDGKLFEELARLEPHGAGNAPPCFLSRRLEVRECRIVGERHLSFRLRCSETGRVVDAFGFRMAPRMSQVGPSIDAAYTPEWQVREGLGRPRLRLVDFIKST